LSSECHLFVIALFGTIGPYSSIRRHSLLGENYEQIA
jgi:hypothetical protein